MKHKATAILLTFVLGGCSTQAPLEPPQRTTREEIVQRFVASWPLSEEALLKTITGEDSARLAETISSLSEAGEFATSLVKVSEAAAPRDGIAAAENVIVGVISLDYAGGPHFKLDARFEIRRKRVVAQPSAISDRLPTWGPIHIETFGSPKRGDILSRNGNPMAIGERGARTVLDPIFTPVIDLIDDELNERLGGRSGGRMTAGDPPQILYEAEMFDGENVRTSLDEELQKAAVHALDGQPGALVAVDPSTGGIRALASNPNPRDSSRLSTSSAYSPGSTFKIVTAAAALESSEVGLDDVLACPAHIGAGDRTISNYRGIDYGAISFKRAFEVSCNTAFATVGLRLGPQRLLQTAQKFGFEVSRSGKAGTIKAPQSAAEMALYSIGAAGSFASPLTIAGVGLVVARRGMGGTPSWSDSTTNTQRLLDSKTAETLLRMMEGVVSQGTGRKAALPGVTLAGKTGTVDSAQAGLGESDSWFVALAPSRGTRLVVVGFLPGAGAGGDFAAPMVASFLSATQALWYR